MLPVVGRSRPQLPGSTYASVYEVRAFTLREVTVPVLPPGSSPLRVLHLSDTHMTPGQHKKQRWLRGLADLQPDLVINTGDNLAHLDAVPSVLEAYGDLLDIPGAFVFGSNDYFAPHAQESGSLPDAAAPVRRRPSSATQRDLPFEELRTAFTGRGWTDLTNRHASLEVAGHSLAFVGVDDPHLELRRAR